ncbi:MAG: Crp/Fnr family transcriptional regulator [Betaproteobacteria bacterium]|nr:Crp/Fnr family transcriptional regulator [Betaproteobacteria bacterium]
MTDPALLFPPLAGLPPELAAEVARQVRPMAAPAGTVLFDAGAACQALPLVLEGRIKVSKRAGNGREIRLYGVHPGELCIVTVSCLLGGDAYPATGIAETPVSALGVPRALFLRLVAEHPPFRDVVFRLFAERMSGLMQLVEEVAFRKLDQRLAAWLLARAPLIQASHQGIADELGSVREIVSRLLKQFEEQGWVRLGRERVEVIDPDGLKRLLAL